MVFLLAGGQVAHAANARRQLEVQNHTSEPVRVFVAYHTITNSGQWVWRNADFSRWWILKPGQRSALNDQGFIINADLIRIWARGEKSGRTWDWGELFIGSAARGPSRVVGKTLFTIWSEDGLPLFSNRHTRRQVAVKNATSETLIICVAYHTYRPDGTWGWQNTDCNVHWTFKPGEHSYLAIDDVRINANAVKIAARSVSGDRVWSEHRDEPFFVGDFEGTGGVKGSTTYTFTEDRARGYEPLALLSVKLKPPAVKAGLSVGVVMEYMVDGLSAGEAHSVREEQRVVHAGKVVARFSSTARRPPGSYRSTRKINIPIVAQPGTYTIVASVSTGRKVNGFLGVHLRALTPEMARKAGLKGKGGALVDRVKRGSPAHESGLKKGDVILALDGQPVDSREKLVSLLSSKEPKTTVALTVLRKGSQRKIKATLGEPPKGASTYRSASKRATLKVLAP
jgi:hypothetical protein